MTIAPEARRAPRRNRTFHAIAASLVVIALGVAGCGSDGEGTSRGAAGPKPTAPAAKKAVTVDIASFKFMPDPIRVKRGATVTFVNKDKAPHTAQTELNPKTAEFDTGRLAKAQTKAVTLTETGRFEYFCAYHRFMEGTVEVVE